MYCSIIPLLREILWQWLYPVTVAYNCKYPGIKSTEVFHKYFLEIIENPNLNFSAPK